MSETMKPCPFCGGSARLARIISPEGEARGERPSYDVSCRECWLWSRWDSEAEAIAAWNRRSHPATGRPTREEVARIVDPLAAWSGVGWKHNFDTHAEAQRWAEGKQAEALAKADQILSLFAPSPPPGDPE